MPVDISERELVSAVPLTEMIAYLGLKRRRRSFQCPNHATHSHNDQSPSTYIHATGNSWTCYKCNTGGTIVDLVMLAHGLSRDAARVAIADYAGIPASASDGRFRSSCAPPSASQSRPQPTPPPAADQSVHSYLCEAQSILHEAPSATYLTQRGIPLAIATNAKLGFAPRGTWPNPRGSAQPRIIAPLTTPDGVLLNLYGRSITQCNKAYRHDFLEGPKGLFNARALTAPTVVLTEGVFDALSVLAAAWPAAALCGLTIRDEWWPLIPAQYIILALDADAPGQHQATELARSLTRLGKRTSNLTAAVLAPHKDLNEYWVANHALPPPLLTALTTNKD